MRLEHEEGKKNEVVVIGCWDVWFDRILLVQWLLYKDMLNNCHYDGIFVGFTTTSY